MKAYILSILGIVVAGIIIDIIIPSGTINKYIKSIYSIFIVAVLIMPIINFLQNPNFSISYSDIELQKNVISYIYNVRVNNMEKDIENHFKYEGFNNLDIDISFSILNNEIIYNSCVVNAKNLLISADKSHINKYEFIKEVVMDYTNLDGQEIVIDE